ncbi:hypothetical protein [Parafrankia sp. FMc2]|uniref:hypothetical protein n=1 Tax=Parafrankia sp. FMc2 TaxID=3233196 RepID=UPI0034D52002
MTAATTAQELRNQADALDTAAFESRQRCGADGALTQRSSGLLADEKRLEAAIIERGGVWDFPALFDLDGNLVPARQVEQEFRGRTRRVWRLLDANGRGIGWFNPSQAEDKDRRRATNAKKGYYLGRALAPARAELLGSHITTVRAYAVRTDGGWSADVTVIDNGQRDERAETIAAYRTAWAARDHKAIAALENAADAGSYVAELIAARKSA